MNNATQTIIRAKKRLADELQSAREQLNIAKRYLERIAKAEFPNAEYIPVEMFYELQLIARSALSQINGKGESTHE
jgi:hypothetical protein